MGLTLSKPEHLLIRVSLGFLYAFFIVGYLNTFSDYCNTVFENYKKKRLFSFTGADSSLLGADSKQPLGADS